MNTVIQTVIKRDRFYFRCSKATSLIKGFKRVYEKLIHLNETQHIVF